MLYVFLYGFACFHLSIYVSALTIISSSSFLCCFSSSYNGSGFSKQVIGSFGFLAVRAHVRVNLCVRVRARRCVRLWSRVGLGT